MSPRTTDARLAARPGPILIVEDDEGLQEVFSLALSDTYEVKRAMSAGEALAIVRHEPVALMLLDYRLPDGTGLELLNDLRAFDGRLPVIMVTGYGSEWVCTSAFKLGITDYLPKPVSMVDLLQSVQRAMASPTGVGPLSGARRVEPAGD